MAKKKKKIDNILGWLTKGEFVIKEPSARKIGYDTLEYMNTYGKLPTYDARKRSKKNA